MIFVATRTHATLLYNRQPQASQACMPGGGSVDGGELYLAASPARTEV